MTRETWGSKIGFIFAAAGSAVGLANIWRFPYMVGNSGGAIFLLLYLVCLVFIGFPVFMSEVIIGRATHLSPAGAFFQLGKSRLWALSGKLVILTGFIVSAFYSAVAAWVLGYLLEAVKGNLTHFESSQMASVYFSSFVESPAWCLSLHFLFIIFCLGILLMGVRGGIEKGNKIFMPLLYIVLLILVVRSLTLPNAWEGIHFLFYPDWRELTPKIFILALGQAFFTLSLGQGTMVTYGSYLKREDNLITSCMPVAFMDTFVSLFSAIAVFGIVFSVGLKPDSGPSLIFTTLPLVFSQLPFGYILAILFFALIFFAAVTSEISAMEPSIAYLMDNHRFSRKKATTLVGCGAFLLGLPCALSTSYLKEYTLWSMTALDLLETLATSILLPLGGFLAVVLVGWIWGVDKAVAHLKEGASQMLFRHHWISFYFKVCFKYVAPLLIVFVFLNAIGLFG